VRAFLVLSIISLALTAAAQQPEKVIGSPIDTSAFTAKDTLKIVDSAIVIQDEKPVVINTDSLGPRKHSPKTATLLSAVIPGAGQVYNRKNWWWKVPIIYGGGAALTYGAIFYQSNYKDFQQAYRYTQSTGLPTGDPRYDKYEPATMASIRDSYRTARDQCIIGLALLYTLQIVDACVEAHFLDFNVNENLSLNIQPQFVIGGPVNYTSVAFTFKLK
jgi:hypothetical protein